MRRAKFIIDICKTVEVAHGGVSDIDIWISMSIIYFVTQMTEKCATHDSDGFTSWWGLFQEKWASSSALRLV